MEKKYLCIDVGGSSIKYAIYNKNYDKLESGKCDVTASTREEFVDEIYDLYQHYLDVEGIAVSYCGELDQNKGFIINGGSYQFNTQFALKDALSNKCKTKIAIENDGNCAALAEVNHGCLKEYHDAVVLVLGTGVACSVVMDKKIHHGVHYFSGFLTGALNDIRGKQCHDNWYLRSIAAGGLVKMLPGCKDGKEFFEEYDKGNPEAIDALSRFSHNIAGVIYNLQLLLDLDAVAIGGGISVQPVLLDKIKESMAEFFEPVEKFHIQRPDVRICEYKNDANLIGALDHYFEMYDE